MTSRFINVDNGQRVSFPGLFAALASGSVRGFPALRPHQRPALHMFLVQLGALALWHQSSEARTPADFPTDPAFWADALRALTSDHPDDAPWRLVVDDDSKPAFLQPPAPDGLSWSAVETADALDLLITSRNHDLKQTIARRATVEDWVFALVSLQTTEGYGGKGNQGIARMNGGSSSRSMLSFAPAATEHDNTVDHSGWWITDVTELLARRAAGMENGHGTIGGPALLWCSPWPEGEQLDMRALDPWFIEVCRRVRLSNVASISARRSTSKKTRIDAKAFKGSVGDPWAPVHKTEGKALTLGGGDFDYRRLCSLLFSGEWDVPALARRSASRSSSVLLVAEALSRGNAKTEGFKSRVLPIPGRVARRLFSSPTAADLSSRQMVEVEQFDKALRTSLALVAARGDRELLNKDHYGFSRVARTRFNRAVDRFFFPSLWRRFEAASDPAANERERSVFLRQLSQAARSEFESALPGIPCTTIQRPRAEARARKWFRDSLWRTFPEGFDQGGTQS